MPNAKTPVKLVHNELKTDDGEPVTITVPTSTASVLTKGDRGWEVVGEADKPSEAPVDAPPAPPALTRNRPTTAGTTGEEA